MRCGAKTEAIIIRVNCQIGLLLFLTRPKLRLLLSRHSFTLRRLRWVLDSTAWSRHTPNYH